MQFDANQGPTAVLAISQKSSSSSKSIRVYQPKISVALACRRSSHLSPSLDSVRKVDDDNNVKVKYPPIRCWLVAEELL